MHDTVTFLQLVIQEKQGPKCSYTGLFFCLWPKTVEVAYYKKMRATGESLMGWVWIALGGALGATARVGLMHVVPREAFFLPLRVFAVNVIGCLLIGLLTAFMTKHGDLSIAARHFLVQGVLGGFTTFSAFALEVGLLYERGLILSASLYIALSVFLSIGAFFLGLRAVKALL